MTFTPCRRRSITGQCLGCFHNFNTMAANPFRHDTVTTRMSVDTISKTLKNALSHFSYTDDDGTHEMACYHASEGYFHVFVHMNHEPVYYCITAYCACDGDPGSIVVVFNRILGRYDACYRVQSVLMSSLTERSLVAWRDPIYDVSAETLRQHLSLASPENHICSRSSNLKYVAKSCNNPANVRHLAEPESIALLLGITVEPAMAFTTMHCCALYILIQLALLDECGAFRGDDGAMEALRTHAATPSEPPSSMVPLVKHIAIRYASRLLSLLA